MRQLSESLVLASNVLLDHVELVRLDCILDDNDEHGLEERGIDGWIGDSGSGLEAL